MKHTISLKNNYEFRRVYRKARFYAGQFMVLYVLKNKHNYNRLGITASRKFGKSIKRNRVRRLIKENYRQIEENIKIGYDLVVIARKTDKVPEYIEIKKEMKFLFKKLNMVSK
ncbi:ribonuclease P protein component [Herbivorax sp. ANBcel31]|uniref:ribonuclease P protein component n=1 Tax=Herbivorax sp. ANBcel31 TaxID=3069754 RepID=UPI0027B2F34D|nr:ribonuclease P protein component [Herbivorax sp. ANBcel31]MDQ2086014.1 ribonuclease P protein component [Herbivorax sp. ANBcel31]